jgi:Phage major capsid protein E
MPNPAQSDLHVNAPLTNVSIAYIQDKSKFVADKIFPKVPVQKQSDLYWKYSKSDWRKTEVRRRAPGTESAGTGWKFDTDSYFAHVYAVHKDVDDQIRANADSNFRLDSDATKFVTNQLLLSRDLDWYATYFKTGVWTGIGADQTGVAGTPGANEFKQWNDTGSDPIGDVKKWFDDFEEQSGFRPNKAVFGVDTMRHLTQHPDLLDRIKYTQRGVVTEELVASLLGVDNVLVARTTKVTGPEINDTDDQDAAAVYAFMANKKAAAFFYAPDSPSLMTPSAGYVFTWGGYLGGNSEGIRIKRFRMDNIAADRVEAEMTYDMKVVSADMGIFAASAVA